MQTPSQEVMGIGVPFNSMQSRASPGYGQGPVGGDTSLNQQPGLSRLQIMAKATKLLTLELPPSLPVCLNGLSPWKQCFDR